MVFFRVVCSCLHAELYSFRGKRKKREKKKEEEKEGIYSDNGTDERNRNGASQIDVCMQTYQIEKH